SRCSLLRYALDAALPVLAACLCRFLSRSAPTFVLARVGGQHGGADRLGVIALGCRGCRRHRCRRGTACCRRATPTCIVPSHRSFQVFALMSLTTAASLSFSDKALLA